MFSIRCNSQTKLGRNSNNKNEKDPQRITKIKLSINKFNWQGINYPSEKDD